MLSKDIRGKCDPGGSLRGWRYHRDATIRGDSLRRRGRVGRPERGEIEKLHRLAVVGKVDKGENTVASAWCVVWAGAEVDVGMKRKVKQVGKEGSCEWSMLDGGGWMGSIVSEEWCVVWWLETSTSTGASTSGTPASELCPPELRPKNSRMGRGQS